VKTAFFAAAVTFLALSPVALQAQTSGPLAINVMSTAAFVDNATWNHMFAIQASRLALEKSEDPKIREFAQMMIRDHSREYKVLATTASSDPVALSPPTKLDRDNGLLLDKLILASGPEFDKLYTTLLVDRQERAVQLHRTYSMTGEDPALRQLAASTATRARERLARAAQLEPATNNERLASGGR
jgi:putative membrane protein